MSGSGVHKKNNISKMQEVDKEKEYLQGCLKIAQVKFDRARVDSMMRKFCAKEIKTIEEKLEK